LLPGIARAGVLLNAGNQASIAIVDEILRASRDIAIEVVPVEFRRAEDLPQAIERTERLGAQALILTGDAILVASRKTVIDLAHSKRMATFFNYRFEAA